LEAAYRKRLMSKSQCKVTFQPSGRSVFVLTGTKIVEAAGLAGMNIDTPCGGQGTCGKCQVHITSGATAPLETEKRAFASEELSEGWRLACQTPVLGDMIIHVPDSSLMFTTQQILTATRDIAKIEAQPAVRKIYIQLREPSRKDSKPDLERLEDQIGCCKMSLAQIRSLPKWLRDNDFKGTAVLLDHHLIDFEPGDTTHQCYGAAFDIGTSTIVGSLLDLCNGSELEITARINPQVAYGDDILTRINHACSCGQCLQQLHAEVIASINEMIENMCQRKDIDREKIYEVVIAGNTTMEHLVCRIDPSSLGKVPFVPVHSKGLMFSASELGISIHHRGWVYVFPLLGGFVGGDITAGILVTDLASKAGPFLLLDVGTNGEIVLAKDGGIWASSTAAGPALEGARISCGMRATHGAIEKVVFNDDVRCSTIGNVAPVGICGSGLIDLAAELLNNRLVSTNGRLLFSDECPAQVPDAIKRRIRRQEDGQIEFLVYEPPQGRKDLRVTVTQRDIREIQLAVGAIRAGIEILLHNTNTKATDLKKVFIAGGFGAFIRTANAQRIGLLPRRIDRSKISFVGNTSLGGAQWALLSIPAREKAEEIAKKVSHVQLSLDPNFQEEFVKAMIFPENPVT